MLSININGIIKKVKPEIKNNKENLRSARDILSCINIPSDFSYYSELKNFPSNISDVEDEVNGIDKWVDERIEEFSEVENKNMSIMDSVFGSMDSLSLDVNAEATGATISNTAETGGFMQDVKTIISNVIDYIKSGDFILDAKDFAKETAAEVAKNVESAISYALATGAKIVDNLGTLLSEVGSNIEDIGAKISSAFDFVYDKVLAPLGYGIAKVAATIDNLVIGVIKGLADLVQALVKAGGIFSAVQFLTITGNVDFINGIITLLKGGSLKDMPSLTKKLIDGTMAFVAEDYVGNVYKDFYENNDMGKLLDEYAFSPFKSDGIATSIASGIGYVAGIIAITIATFGIGGVAAGAGAAGGTAAGAAASAGTAGVGFGSSTAVSAGISALAGFGKYSGEEWAKLRDSSWEGINRKYENGEITKEQYDYFVKIRGDEGWAEIEKNYKEGKISKEEYEQAKQIREMPEDWTTSLNALKGIGYGAVNGLWEGVQWYVGGKLNNFAIEGSKAASSAVRIGVDSVFNAADTPFRAIVDSVISGKDYEEAWVEQGGWKSLLANLGIGLAGSVGGEIFDNIKLNKIEKSLNSRQVFDGLDETTAKKVKTALLNDHRKGNIDLSKITDSELEEVVKNKVLKIGEKETEKVFKAGIKKATRKINGKKIFENVDDSLKNQVRANLMDKHIRGEIDLNKMSKADLQKCINAEEGILKDKLKSIIKNSDFNKKNLIEGIANTIPKDLDDLTKARMIYLKLNQSLTYSDNWFAMNKVKDLYKEQMSEIYNRKFDISNLTTNSVVCSNWSKIYADLLQEVGIDPKKIEIMQANKGSHRWVKMELDDGKILFADATNNINGMTDLVNSKLGNPTGGFIVTTPKEYEVNKNITRSEANALKALSANANLTLKKIDENIGYSNRQYMTDFEDIIEMYRQFSSNPIPLDDKLIIFRDLLESDNYSAVDVFTISREYAPNLFGSDASTNLFIKGDNTITVIEIWSDDDNVKYLYKINDSDINTTDDISNIIKGATKIR